MIRAVMARVLVTCADFTRWTLPAAPAAPTRAAADRDRGRDRVCDDAGRPVRYRDRTLARVAP